MAPVLVGGHKITTTYPGGVAETVESYLDGDLKAITGGAVAPKSYLHYYSLGGPLPNSDGWKVDFEVTGNPSEIVVRQRTTDMLGRERYLLHDAVETFGDYDTLGRVASRTRGGLNPVTVDYTYGAGPAEPMGSVKTATLNSNDDGVRTAFASEHFEQSGGAWFRVKATNHGKKKEKLTGLAATVMSQIETIDGLGNATLETTTVNRGAATVTRTASRTGFRDAVTISRLGLVQSVTTGSVSVPAVFTYDGLRRQIKSTDPRTGAATTVSYAGNPFGQPSQVTSPAGTISGAYYPPTDPRAGQLLYRTENGVTTRFDYDARGNLTPCMGRDVSSAF